MASSMLTAEVSTSAPKEADVDEALKSALHSCANDPDFAVICDFLQKFSKDLGLDLPNFKLLLQWLTKTDEVSPQLREMQIKLLRKTRKTVHEKSWESALSKFCFTYSAQDAWEIERFGYKNSSVKVKLRILRELLECQFERNAKFRAKILTLSADSLRSQPIGRDRLGHAYWITQDNDCNIRIYQEHLDEEIWQVVATNRDEFVNLIKRLRASEVVLPCTDIGLIDEDTSSSSSSNMESTGEQRAHPPEEKDDSQEDEQKVPKLSIKLLHGKSSKETTNFKKDVGKGEEELAAEEDAQKLKKSNIVGKEANNESGEEEFEEVEEEYEDESEGSEGESDAEEEDDDDIEEDNKIPKKKNDQETEQNLQKTTKANKDDDNKKVKPLLISQNKVLNNENTATTAKKRALDQVDATSPPRNDSSQQLSALKKSRPSLMDSKRSKSLNKFEDNKDKGEEDYEEESVEEDGDVEEEIEEEDIDSVAAEEDENEEKQFEDDDDDDEEDEEDEVGEEITDPVVHVTGEGTGKECDVGNFMLCSDYDLDNENDMNVLSEVIVEEVCYVWGEGSGKDCLVGNKNQDDEETNAVKSELDITKNTNVELAKSETELETNLPKLKLSPSKETIPNDEDKAKELKKIADDLEEKKEKKTPEEISNKDTENGKEILTKDDKNKINGENKTKQTVTKNETLDKKPLDASETGAKITPTDEKSSQDTTQEAKEKDLTKILTKPDSDVANATGQLTHASKMSVLESLKKELRESKQKLLEKKTPAKEDSSTTTAKISSPAIYNRKRRLTDQLQTTSIRPPNSESEIDLNSENAEDVLNDQELEMDDMDVGGKRLKMRPKQTNSELRKKIEAKKVAANDETTSSSGGEEELRRRKKIMLTKESPTKKPEDERQNLAAKADNLTKNNEDSNAISEKSKIPTVAATPQPPTIKKPTQITPTKVKPTLDEIIEKKLKKTPEKIDKEKTTTTDNGSTVVVATTAKALFPSPNKSPITKPLKKNLLTQIRQEESDEDAVPRKRTNSQDLNSQNSEDIKTPDNTTTTTTKNVVDTKTIVNKIDPERQQRTTPERQRKRRSSEETAQNDSPEEPEAKKEVTDSKDKDIGTKLDKIADTIKEEDIIADPKENEIKRESPTPTSGRRSGRRSGVTPAYVDTTLQAKRNRGGVKNSLKKETNECDKVAVIKEENESKETKAPAATSKKDIKEKNKTEDKSADESISKENNSEDVKTNKKKPNTTTAADQTPKNAAKSSPTTTKTPQKGTRKKREVDATNIIDVDSETPVRQSRRIAQQKIREEAERRKLEEIALRTMKQELKKKKKAEKQADPTVVPPTTEPSSESEESDVETKRKVQKKKCPGKNGNWSSGSEEQEEPDEEDEEPPHYETDPGSPLFKSDHEFSPESDIEDESQVVPMKRARTVRKEDAGDDGTAAAEEEEACQKCNKSDHPEWILLCDNCDKGYHCSCLSPVLFYIPEGDWYCPPCQQEQLIKALESQLKEFDDLVENKRKEEERVKRLAEEEKARQEKEEAATKKRKNKNEHKIKGKRGNDDSSGEEHSKDDDEDEDEDEESSTNSEDSRNSRSKKSSSKNKNRNRSKNTKKSDKRNHRNRRHNTTRTRRGRGQQKRGGGKDSDSDSQNSSKSKSDSKSDSSSSSSTYSESDNEPIYKLRKRRQINVSYRLNEYDDLINSALKKEMDEAAGAGNLGRGKDISTIIEADKEEKARQKQIEDGDGEAEGGEIVVKPKQEESEGKYKANEETEGAQVKKEPSLKTDELKATTKEDKKENIKQKAEGDDDDDSDAEPIMRKFNIKPSQKKKSRKLTTLDISSEDDDGSDEDFKGSSLDDDEEEDTSISASNSDSSLEIYKRKGKSKKKRRKAARRAFRERRKDRRFVVDESDDEEVQRPKSKKKRKDDSDYTESEADDDDISELSENIDSADLCDDTTTDESDGNWRPNKRKKAKKSNTSFSQKSPKTKSTNNKKPKKVEYSDDDVSESEESEEDDDDNDNIGSGKGMGKQPRSQPLKTTSSASKTKGKGKEKPPAKTKKKKKSSEDEDSQSGSEDSTRRTRGRRYAYIEDFDDDSSDGGIKPGVQRPDTPPEEREKFIKRQEEIKRMLAEKNAEGAKLVATPRLTPIKTDSDKDKRSPAKAGGDSLSTVPLSVIRQAKVLDIDYLQRRGENLDDLSNDVGDVDDDFDDADLPDDLPEDMDEDAIARMVEEEEEFGAAAARDLPPPDEVLRTTTLAKTPIKIKELEKPLLPVSMPASFPTTSPQVTSTPLTTTTSASGLQEPVRKRLPMPTMHPPLLRHQFLMHESMSNTHHHHLMQRHGGPPPPTPTSHLLQNALSAPLSQPLDRNYPPTTPSPAHHSLINRMIQNMPMQQTVPHSLSTTRPPPHQPPPSSSSSAASLTSSLVAKTLPQHEHLTQDKSTNPQPVPENKPRGRRKKITPLRDTLQKQQTAAAVTAATATNSALASAIVKKNESVVASGSSSLPPSVIKSSSPTKLPMQTSVIQSMPPTSSHPLANRPGVNMPPGAYGRTDGPRYYEPLGNRIPQTAVQRHRGPPQLPPSLLPPHPANRSSYGPPPPLKGSSTAPPGPSSSSSTTPGSIRNPLHHVPPPYLGMPPNARHASPHLNMYSRPPIYGNPNFGPRVNLRPPPNIHAPEYSAGSRAYPPYGFYPPPPPLTTPPGQRSGPSAPPPRAPTQMPPVPASTLTQPPASVIVTAAAASKSSNAPAALTKPTPPPHSPSEPNKEISKTGSSSSSKPSLVAQELTNKQSPPKTTSPAPVAKQTEKSVIAATAAAAAASVTGTEPRRKLTTLQAFNTNIATKKTPERTAEGNTSVSQSSPVQPNEVNDDSSTHGPSENATTTEEPETRPEGQASEFSGLVSYFSSQHDDYNT